MESGHNFKTAIDESLTISPDEEAAFLKVLVEAKRIANAFFSEGK